MDKITYLSELAEGLARWVPDRERQNILCYYAEYFEEAGPDREAEAIAELGDPWALSSRLAVESGYVTAEQAAAWTPKRRQKWPWVLAAVAIVAVSVASLVSWVGGFIGRTVSAYVRGGTAIVEQVEPLGTPAPAIDFAGATSAGEGAGSWSTVPFDAIDADISLGDVTVVAGDDYVLSVEQADLGGYGLKWEVKGGTLKIKDNGKNGSLGLDGLKALGGGSVAVTVIIPEGTTLDRFSGKTGLGNVTLWGVSAKKMTAETGMGNVECYETWYAEKIELETGMGNVTLNMEEPYDGVDIDLKSGMGNVEVSLGGSEPDWDYELKSGLGNVTVNGRNRGDKAERKGSASYKLDAESGMGDVNVYFQND